ncbi:DoxX family protein [Saccharothrix variisporea]|uniref:Putative membrane protein YphA (DoxX/SURF4 family) n=1 Tax=Saccharothrix variisporea TaxID=543527 RepID=A0A495X8Y2_9PSEU|nr:DoxX family protein [Saccharothrix variisporea]RKT70079.1 putative membrane protein YphA (DoxX/SURF4 family) [Saccharothrix variisporea]
MDLIVLIGRVLFVLLFLNSAFGHFTKTEGMAGYAESKGVPSPRLATQASGAVQLVGALMVLLGVWADLGALLLVLFLLPTAFVMHAFWKESDPQAKQMGMTQFLKDVSLAGAALMFFGLYAGAGSELGLTVTGPLF